MADNTPAALLLYPPVADPTAAYHSLVYVASFARARGFTNVEVRDTNVEALDYCARPEVSARALERWGERRRELGGRPRLTRFEQLQYAHLLRARALEPESAREAINALKDPESFYDYAAYRRAVRTLRLWMGSLPCENFPGQFGDDALSFGGGLFSLSSVKDLTDEGLLERVASPFREYYEEVLFPEMRRRRYAVVGVGVTYTNQLPYALWLARAVRRVLPDCYLVCGGTEVSGVWKYAPDPRRFARIFGAFDACVVGEGETAFVRILEALDAGRRPEAVNNVVFPARAADGAPPPRIAYEDLDALPTPEYELVRPDLYFSPHRFAYYSPTRGCYWNKCTFCDYGLNFDSPTSPWRQRRTEAVVADLKRLSAYTPYMYLSVDVLAPGSLLKLARLIAEEGIEVRWSAEMRLEKYFDEEKCAELRRGGCVAVSVGFESGSQRILDRIRKGTSLEQIGGALKGFSRAGIAVQMMGFTDFPTETCEEALETVSYLKRTGDLWNTAGIGEFALTRGAIVARRPEEFGIGAVRTLDGDDIGRHLTYEEAGGPAKSPEQARLVEEGKKELNRTEFDRPFAGGIDSAHSIFYYARFGRAFPGRVVPAARASEGPAPDAPVRLNGRLIPHERFDLINLFGAADLADLHRRAARERGAALDSAAVREALAEGAGDALPVAKENPYFLRSDGELIPCSFEALNILESVDGRRTLDEVLALAAQGEPEDRQAEYRLLAHVLALLEVITPAPHLARMRELRRKEGAPELKR